MPKKNRNILQSGDGPRNIDINVKENPIETHELRKGLKIFYDTPYKIKQDGEIDSIGQCKWGVYVFYDYDGEPIYVGQTCERVSARIGRHLTNQRTDAVAMSVLDPFEVFEIAVWPLPEYQNLKKPNRPDAKWKAAKTHLDNLEAAVFKLVFQSAEHGGALNEKYPSSTVSLNPGEPAVRGAIVNAEVSAIRSHPDTRIARRADTISRLARVVSERNVQPGLRRTLVVQAKRLAHLAERRLTAFDKEIEKDDEK